MSVLQVVAKHSAIGTDQLIWKVENAHQSQLTPE